MRRRSGDEDLSVFAIAGTHVVLLGINASEATIDGLLGFTIKRSPGYDGAEFEMLGGGRIFEADQGNAERHDFRSDRAPIQAFQWSDYTVEPGTAYTYEVVPVKGEPGALQAGVGVEVTIETESPGGDTHGIYFNRGVAGSQAYSRHFGKYQKYYPQSFTDKKTGEKRTYVKPFLKPEDVPDREAYVWLSRGLEEAMLHFIGHAEDSRYALRAAVYEFTYQPALQAFLDALERGADVKIVHHAKQGKAYRLQRKRRGARYKVGENGRVEWNEDTMELWEDLVPDTVAAAATAAIEKLGLSKPEFLKAFERMFISRENTAAISHNKFIVLLKDGEPIEVWTGSTNYTAGGIFGQSNVGHVVRDADVAASYLAYWNKLAEDPVRLKKLEDDTDLKDIRNWNIDHQPDLASGELPKEKSITPIFSPRPTTAMLDWYAERFAGAKSSLHFTAAFSVAEQLFDVFKVEKGDAEGPYLRYILLEGIKSKGVKDKVPEMQKHWQNRIAWGDTLKKHKGDDEHLESLTGLNYFVNYLHTKYVLIDPLTDDPIVITGSANFSDASTDTNDENMLIIRGNKRVADIFLGEFMRLFNHFHVRNVANAIDDDEAARQAAYLAPDDSWTKPHYAEGTQEMEERLLFA